MGRSYFLKILLLLALLALSFSHGYGRKLMETVEVGGFSVQTEEIGGKSRKMIEVVLDYQLDPGPNTNPKTGYIYGPPPKGR